MTFDNKKKYFQKPAVKNKHGEGRGAGAKNTRGHTRNPYTPKAALPRTNQETHPKFPAQHAVEGTIRVNAKGTGYVEVEGMEDDIEVVEADLNTALDKDRVTIVLHGKRANARQTGEVTAVLFRNKTKFVGILEREGGSFFLQPDDFKMYRSILIPKNELNEAKVGEKVYVEINKWTDPKQGPIGKVLKILGAPGGNDVEMEAIALERGFDTSFDQDVHDAAEAIPLAIPEHTIAERLASPIGRDFRDVLTFTIDPADAKDFDDALSWKKLSDGNIEVGVHIADVSHYVTPGSRIDKEAVERATSIYLVDRTIPMLPERLSNGICSLVQGEDRLTFSAVFTMNTRGEVLKEWFGKTIIHSTHRFSYEDAQKVIDTKEGPCLEALLSLNALAKALRKARIANGAIAFEAEEVRFELDKTGKPLRVYKKILQDTNKLIEEFMLLANKHVASLIALKDTRTASAFIYRIHDAPNEERIQDLRDFLSGIGYELKRDKFGQITSQNINKMLEDVRGRAEEAMIQMATVRAMAKAVYATKNLGHFGLGFEYYTHFTSPIRRYPDLLVHRLLESYLLAKPVPKKTLAEQEHLARYCSQMEVSAAEAERASIRYKQCEYFAERIGVELNGTISGVTEWGLYVEDPETKTEGMVHVRDIPNDFYFFEQKNYRLVGKNTKKSYRLGDKARVKIMSVDLKKKLIGMKLL